MQKYYSFSLISYFASTFLPQTFKNKNQKEKEWQKNHVTLQIICLLGMTKTWKDEYCLWQHPDKQKLAS